MPRFKSIKEVPARLKLIRVLANWENVNRTPLNQRSWDGTTYKSPNALVTPDVISVIQPHTNKLFVVFLTGKGEVTIPRGKSLAAVYRTDDLFIESGDGADDVLLQSNRLRIKNQDDIGKGLIIHLK